MIQFCSNCVNYESNPFTGPCAGCLDDWGAKINFRPKPENPPDAPYDPFGSVVAALGGVALALKVLSDEPKRPSRHDALDGLFDAVEAFAHNDHRWPDCPVHHPDESLRELQVAYWACLEAAE